jgi:hypothetical protein
MIAVISTLVLAFVFVFGFPLSVHVAAILLKAMLVLAKDVVSWVLRRVEDRCSQTGRRKRQ